MSVPVFSSTPVEPVEAEQRFAALERALLHGFLAATPLETRGELGLRVDEHRGAVVVACEASPHLFVNRIVGLGLDEPATPRQLDRALARVRVGSRRDNFVVSVSPHARPTELETWTRERGLVPFRRDWHLLARVSAPAREASTPFRLVRATRRDGERFAEIVCEGLQLPLALVPGLAGLLDHPGWHAYLAMDGARPVAAAGLFVHGRTGYLAMAATRPSHRGASAHDALIARRVQVACALGCDLLLCETGAPIAGEPSPSLENLRTGGFVPISTRRNRAPPGTTWTG